MELPKELTFGQLLDPAMQITDQGEADTYFEAMVARTMRFYGHSRERAEAVARENLGYWAGLLQP